MAYMLITVVTVCLNEEKNIETTLESVLNQKYNNFEYLIKDGVSSDSTLQIVESYSEAFRSKNIEFRIISEKDSGIYDAMNNAVEYSRGEWIIFLNAGDGFFDSYTLNRISKVLNQEDYVVYGNTLLCENGYYKFAKAGSIAELSKHNPICHQSTFTKKSIILQYKFNTAYKIAADYDLYIRIAKDYPERFK